MTAAKEHPIMADANTPAGELPLADPFAEGPTADVASEVASKEGMIGGGAAAAGPLPNVAIPKIARNNVDIEAVAAEPNRDEHGVFKE